MSGTKQRAALIIGILVVAGIPLHLLFKGATDISLLSYNERAPLLQGPTLDGGRYDSARDTGKVRVISFIDPRRASAVRQAQAVFKWNESYAEQPVVFITVLTGGTPDQQAQFARQTRLDPAYVVADEGGTRAPAFQVKSTPVVYVIDGLDRVRFASDEAVPANHRKFREALEHYLPAAGRRFSRGPE